MTTRRAALTGIALAGAGLLASCASGPPGPKSATPTPSGTLTPSNPDTASPTPSPSDAPAETPRPQTDPSAVAARHAGAQPAEWGTVVTGVVSQLPVAEADGVPLVHLTLDACGGEAGSGYDAGIIDDLRALGIPATLFLNRRWIRANRSAAEDLARDPLFVIGNHGTRHVPLSVTGREIYGLGGTTSAAEAVDEVWGNHEEIADLTGAAPRFFRPGTAHLDEVAARIVHELGETPIGFTVNGDGGATYPASSVAAEVGSAGPGGIVLAHMNQPGSGTRAGLAEALPALRDAGIRFVPLEL